MSAHGSVRVERVGEVARVTIERAAKANALSEALMREFCAALRALEAGPLPRAVVLTGAGGRTFAGGADLGELGALDVPRARAFITLVHETCDAARRFPAPVIARIQGAVLGAGLELAAACDLRIASEDAVFGMPEVRFGIPSVVEAALLPRLVGRGRAAWLLLTAQTIDARTALEWGLVEQVVPAAGLDTAVDALLDTLLALEPGAVREQKRLLNFWDDEPLAQGIAESIESLAASYRDGVPNRLIGNHLAARRGAKPR